MVSNFPFVPAVGTAGGNSFSNGVWTVTRGHSARRAPIPMRLGRLLLAAALMIPATAVRAAVITVSPGGSIAAAVAGASANDIISVQPGTYTNDFPVVNVPLTIEAAGAPGSVTIDDTGFPNDQGIIENFSTLTVNNLVLKGAATSLGGGNNAGAIRDHGSTALTVTNSILEDSQDGILTEDPTRNEVVTINNDQFLNNGGNNGSTHALYVGDAASLDVTNSTFCGTRDGHDVKSKATTTTVSGSTMYIGAAGGGCGATNAGVGVDASFGGIVDLVNDAIIQGSANSNGALIIMGGESPLLTNNSLTITNTTLSGDGNGTGVSELDGNAAASCIAPVAGSGNTVSGLTTDIKPAPCGALNAAVAVDEPSSLWLLLGALAGCCAFWRLRSVWTGMTPSMTLHSGDSRILGGQRL